jgi:hypothetical protein
VYVSRCRFSKVGMCGATVLAFLKLFACPHLMLMKLIDAPVEVVRLLAWLVRFCTCSLSASPLSIERGKQFTCRLGLEEEGGPKGHNDIMQNPIHYM